MTETTDAVAVPGGLLGRVQALVQHKEFERFWKFAVVGGIGFVIDAGTVNLLKVLGIFAAAQLPLAFGLALEEEGIIGTIGFTLAVTSNFLWNRYWTYPDYRSKPVLQQLVTIIGINILGILNRIPILQGLSDPFAQMVGSLTHLENGLAAQIGLNMALMIAVVVVMFWNFFVNRYLTYNDVD